MLGSLTILQSQGRPRISRTRGPRQRQTDGPNVEEDEVSLVGWFCRLPLSRLPLIGLYRIGLHAINRTTLRWSVTLRILNCLPSRVSLSTTARRRGVRFCKVADLYSIADDKHTTLAKDVLEMMRK